MLSQRRNVNCHSSLRKQAASRLRGYGSVPILVSMKRPFLLAALVGAFSFLASNAQDNPAAVAAAREESEARYQRLSSRIDDLETAFQRFQKDLDKLDSQLRGLREQ